MPLNTQQEKSKFCAHLEVVNINVVVAYKSLSIKFMCRNAAMEISKERSMAHAKIRRSSSDLTDTSELAQPQVEVDCWEESLFFRNG
jgi:hypothetical protein